MVPISRSMKGCDNGSVRNGFDFLDIQDAKIRLPAVITKQRIIVGAEVVGDSLVRDSQIEKTTQGDPIDITGMDTQADDAARELVHDHEYPVALQKNGFTAKQVNTPEAVLRVSEEGQPRRTATIGIWPVMRGEDASHDSFINADSECLVYLLRDPWASKPWVVLLQLNDGLDKLW